MSRQDLEAGGRGGVQARDEGVGNDEDSEVGVGKDEGAAVAGRRRRRGGRCTSCRIAPATKARQLLFELGMLECTLQPV